MSRISIEPELCKGCGLCIGVCPVSLIEMSQEYNSKGLSYVYQIDEHLCTGCRLCAIQCPEAAITVYRGE